MILYPAWFAIPRERLRGYLLLLTAVAVAATSARIWWDAARAGIAWPVAVDFTLYTDAARRWLGGGPFYHPYQLAGSYVVTSGADYAPPILYPPPVFALFAPFTVLPAILWWIIPLATLAWAVWRERPSPLGWLVIASFLAWPGTAQTIVPGNPGMWLAAAVSVGLGPFVLLKPTLLPFALSGIGTRRWWLAAGGLAALSLAFLPVWPQYLTAAANARGADLLYSAGQVPLLLMPWVARRTSSRRP